MTKQQHTQQQKHNGLDKDSKCNKKRFEGFKEQESSFESYPRLHFVH